MNKTFNQIWRCLFETEYIINGTDIQFNLLPEQKKILKIVTCGDYTFLEMCEKVEQKIVQLDEKIQSTKNLLEQTDMDILNKWLLDIRKEELKTIGFDLHY